MPFILIILLFVPLLGATAVLSFEYFSEGHSSDDEKKKQYITNLYRFVSPIFIFSLWSFVSLTNLKTSDRNVTEKTKIFSVEYEVDNKNKTKKFYFNKYKEDFISIDSEYDTKGKEYIYITYYPIWSYGIFYDYNIAHAISFEEPKK